MAARVPLGVHGADLLRSACDHHARNRVLGIDCPVGIADALQVTVGERDCAYAHQFSYKNGTRHPTRPSAWPNSVADTLCWREPPRTWCAQQPTDATNGGAASASDRLSVWRRCRAVERIACSPVLLFCSAPSFAAAWGRAHLACSVCGRAVRTPAAEATAAECRFIAKWRRPAFVWGANSLLFEPGHRFVHFGYWAHYFMSDRHADRPLLSRLRVCVCSCGWFASLYFGCPCVCTMRCACGQALLPGWHGVDQAVCDRVRVRCRSIRSPLGVPVAQRPH